MFNLKIAELNNRIKTATDEMSKLVELAEEQDREMNAEEQETYDELQAEITKLEKRVNTLEATQKKIESAPRIEIDNKPAPESVQDAAENAVEKEIKIPASARRFASNLKSFRGEDAEQKAYKAGMWLRAITGSRNAAQWCNDHGLKLELDAVHQEGTNTTGGYLVYDELDRNIIDLRNEYGVFRRYARVVPMTSDTTLRPRRTGGLTAYFVGESSSGTESTKSWDQTRLTAKKLMVLTRMSNELNSDAIISLTDDIVGEIAYAFAYKEDQCGFNGDGTSTYGGIVGVREKLGSAGTNQYDTGYAYNNIALQDITDTTALLPTYARMGARWFMSPTVYNQLEYLRVNAGGNTARDLEAGLNMRFLGYPVVLSEAMPSTAATNQICAIFGDLSLAADFGDRAGTSISVSDSAVVDDDSVFEKDELAVRGTMRFDINVHDAGDSSNAGPIVGLKTHSA